MRLQFARYPNGGLWAVTAHYRGQVVTFVGRVRREVMARAVTEAHQAGAWLRKV